MHFSTRNLTYQILFDHETEENRVSHFPKVLEHQGFQFRVFDDVFELVLVILKHPGGAIVEPGQLADGRHHPKQSCHVLDDCALKLRKQWFIMDCTVL